ncbi:xanthine dehydrogenase family protein molybdopterin-binding subunit [Nocardioides donggukensis]|uniref:Xanthine dehydrogenase family protein molybdopterin-binding subunit n=1 Tax=Nocardioides donggukensis TaxID=2774019 RepID=A0A927K3J6_9ACTN|nr:xanthine dehydrogenase family protein molybdopterin-binding subunit [Nocardioides donggukensis]MBD8869967.1 xanthine dehydrogenase family protein molybdopterin-binding subunit [Nocardioides donggukensis]
MTGSILGNAVPRVEDPDLIRGRGTFVDNLRLDGTLHTAFVRSPYAHATLAGIDTGDAAQAPGVVAVRTAADLGLRPGFPFVRTDPRCARPPLATDRVRFVGEAVAVVVAETRAQAVDAAELVDVDYDDLEPVVDMEAALAQGAAQQFDDVPGNVVQSVRSGQDGALDGAERVVRARILNQRLAVAPIEGNAVVAVPGSPDDQHDLTLHMSTQMPHVAQRAAARALGLEVGRVRVVAPHVGGAFGGKAGLPAEHVVAAAVARQLGRPVAWTETRSEAMLSMHGRGQVQYAELGLSADGRITGLRCRVVGDCGAYGGFGGTLAGGPTLSMAAGVYDIPRIDYSAIAAATNTTPNGAFRGAGRPEATAMIERMVDLAADELGLDPVEIRRRNLPAPEDFPFTTAVGTTYDTGDYATALDEALRLADHDALLREQAERRERGDVVQLGIGLACYVEVTGGGGGEFGTVSVEQDGTVVVRAGTSAHGQGHATSFSMLVADRLGVPLESVRYEQSDTALVPRGEGTGGSRSLQLGGSAVLGAADEVLARARQVAADLLEASVDDIELADGIFGVAGAPGTGVGWAAVVAEADEPLAAEHDFAPAGATYPFGAHVAVVEVDTETGRVRQLRHVAVDDCGRIVNPTIVAGQQMGGLAQGVSQALFEEFRYDEAGNPVTSTFADYLMPSAVDIPPMTLANTVTETPRNPLGAKGIGESATVGATPAVQNAVVDALSHLGVRHLDLPLSPARVASAIRAAAAGELPDPWSEPPAAFEGLELEQVAAEEGGNI